LTTAVLTAAGPSWHACSRLRPNQVEIYFSGDNARQLCRLDRARQQDHGLREGVGVEYSYLFCVSTDATAALSSLAVRSKRIIEGLSRSY
jgi:hypothetical protein